MIIQRYDLQFELINSLTSNHQVRNQYMCCDFPDFFNARKEWWTCSELLFNYMLSFKCTWVTFPYYCLNFFYSCQVTLVFFLVHLVMVLSIFLPTQDCLLISSVLCYFSYCILTFSFWYGVSFLFVLVIDYSFIFCYWFCLCWSLSSFCLFLSWGLLFSIKSVVSFLLTIVLISLLQFVKAASEFCHQKWYLFFFPICNCVICYIPSEMVFIYFLFIVYRRYWKIWIVIVQMNWNYDCVV